MGRPVWAAAAAVSFVFVVGIGVAEVHLLGMPDWLDVVFVALGCVMAADWHYLVRRANPAEDRLARESFPSLALLAPTGAPGALPAAPRREVEPHSALGYTCVPPDDDGRELARATEEITAWCAEGDLAVAKIAHDVEGQTGQRGGGGPALQWALDQIAKGEADTLVVARLRSLSPNVAKLPPLLRWFIEPEQRLVAIDMQLDTATNAGRLAAFALAGVGSWENERLSARTRRGLEAARSRGAGRAGAAVADVPELRERIVRMRNDGMTLQAIADVLNEEGMPTVRGGAKWRPSSVQGAAGYHRPTSTRGIQVPDESPGPRQGPSNKRGPLAPDR
ncbi:MAG: recombinase family protein [Actinomycetota bacterium]|nr:recombinase family protein [Actinomycetota bacterium]